MKTIMINLGDTIFVYVGNKYVDIIEGDDESRIAHGDLIGVEFEAPRPGQGGFVQFGAKGPKVWFMWTEIREFLRLRSAIEALLP